MSSPTFADLSPPPPGKTGWPWTVETPSVPPVRLDGTHWPRVSIVTPSYNQGQFIEGTIRSVLLQGYPNLEYIIIDGGSSDQSVEIIKKYQIVARLLGQREGQRPVTRDQQRARARHRQPV